MATVSAASTPSCRAVASRKISDRDDPGQKLAYVGGAALWEAVEKAAIKHGLATVAGTVNHVGTTSFVDEKCSDLGNRPRVLEGLLCFVSFRYHLTRHYRLDFGRRLRLADRKARVGHRQPSAGTSTNLSKCSHPNI